MSPDIEGILLYWAFSPAIIAKLGVEGLATQLPVAGA